MVKVLFVCLGNICRSPMAEGMFVKHVTNNGLSEEFEVDSAGTGAWHAGQKADKRMREVARSKGVELTSIARQVVQSDFEHFDYIVAMDSSNLSDLQSICPEQHLSKLLLMRDFDAEGKGTGVPDPYYGEGQGFIEVYDILDRSTLTFLKSFER